MKKRHERRSRTAGYQEQPVAWETLDITDLNEAVEEELLSAEGYMETETEYDTETEYGTDDYEDGFTIDSHYVYTAETEDIVDATEDDIYEENVYEEAGMYEEEDGDLEYIEYDDDYMGYDELPGRNFWEKIKNRITGAGTGDKVVAVTGLLVLVLAVAAGIVLIESRMEARQMKALQAMSRQFAQTAVAGKSNMVAMLQSQGGFTENLPGGTEQKEYRETEYEQHAQVNMHLTSIQKDLKIKFQNQDTGRLIANVPFSVTVKNAKGNTVVWTDEDMDGIIYKKKIEPGDYFVAMEKLEDKEEYQGYSVSTTEQKITVKDKIDYQKVDVSDEVKTEAEVDVAKEDTQTKEATESSLADTVTWVESTATAQDGSYVPIDIAKIIKPVSADGTTLTTVSSGNADDYLKSDDGRDVYIADMQSQYILARSTDYYASVTFYVKNDGYKYTGWQTINGKVYYYDVSGNYVTGEQVIQGVKYNFGSDGVLLNGPGTGTETLGIDVSRWNGEIDWNGVKNSGISYVIIRCGYRGSSTGALIEDPKFKSNIQGAAAAGLKVGVYFFTQALDEVEAVEEASMVLELIQGYHISYPVFLDVEPSGGRADGISTETRTTVCSAFCQTIQNNGYTAGIYANKTWLNEKINTGSLGAYKIWLAQYAATADYSGRYDLWQYKCTGQVAGISGNVDMNISYLGY